MERTLRHDHATGTTWFKPRLSLSLMLLVVGWLCFGLVVGRDLFDRWPREVNWISYDEQLVKQMRRRGEPHVIVVGADWDTATAVSRHSFENDERLKHLIYRHGLTMVYVDVTSAIVHDSLLNTRLNDAPPFVMVVDHRGKVVYRSNLVDGRAMAAALGGS